MAEVRVRSQNVGFVVHKAILGHDFLLTIRFSLPNYHATIAPYSFPINDCHSRPQLERSQLTSVLQLT